MKRLLVTAAALALLGAPAAFAQQGGQGGQGQGGGHWQGGQGQGQGGQSQGGQYQGRQGGGQNQGGQYQGGQYQGGQNAGGQGRGSGGGGGGGGGQVQNGRPDWNAYYNKYPDLQRAYQQNRRSPTYTESQDAFAERHYREHGQAEGRQLPTIQGGGQTNPQANTQDQWRGGRWQGRGDRGQPYGDQRYGDQRYNNQNYGDRGRGTGGDRRYDGQDRNRGFGGERRAERRFRADAYEWPRGWSYHRWRYGQYLPQVFFAQDYWIYDYGDFGLPYPPPGCVWVRYGPDALLIDRYTGEIVEVIYGLFY